MAEDESEFSTFVAERAAALFRSAYFLTAGDRAAAEDLVQDALAAAWVRWDSIRDPGAREPFVRQIMVRAATRRWARQKRRPEAASTSAVEVHPSHEDSVAASWDLVQALSRLSAKQRAVIVLRYYHDLTEAQIADALGCSTGSVKTHASRALKALGLSLEGTPYAPASQELP